MALIYLAIIVTDIALATFFLWMGIVIASRIQGMPAGGTYCGWDDALVSVCASSLVGFLLGFVSPFLGFLGSVIVLFIVLQHFTQAGFWENLFIVITSRVCAVATAFFFLPEWG